MSLDPRVHQWLRSLSETGLPALNELPVTAAREAFAAAVSAHGLSRRPAVQVEDRTVQLVTGEVPLRIYTPSGSGPFPALLYFHGGGWTLGSLDSSDGTCSYLAESSHAVVVSVGYSLAPEAGYPVAVDQGVATRLWVDANAASLNIDPERLAIGGDSAGGNLAAVVALASRELPGPPLIHQLLMYPVVTQRTDAQSYRDFASDYFLTADMMTWFFGHYLDGHDHRDNWRVSPLAAPDLSGLPPAHVILAECDPTRDDALAYAGKLAALGVQVTIKVYEGQIHAFVALAEAMPVGKKALDDAAANLRAAFRSGWEPRAWLGH
ncbi:alpha/beta hydrolase [Hoyosella sp. YIM 151337]|uniref:alpha/beta hydrolase n=1 Tax=Hoyosella sp. YIM 151337 TaxID=2992742 RepID=UPI00223602DE|nr:alpha/beta hydrolase [Hoyosella sp. YIM 151337]MCW4354529.1 alpha/beta hydrolase [Hoyosella sp. YIM 151337]